MPKEKRGPDAPRFSLQTDMLVRNFTKQVSRNLSSILIFLLMCELIMFEFGKYNTKGEIDYLVNALVAELLLQQAVFQQK